LFLKTQATTGHLDSLGQAFPLMMSTSHAEDLRTPLEAAFVAAGIDAADACDYSASLKQAHGFDVMRDLTFGEALDANILVGMGFKRGQASRPFYPFAHAARGAARRFRDHQGGCPDRLASAWFRL
jgi:hypothetical protein